MQRVETMSLAEFINSIPDRSDFFWFHLLDLDFGFTAANDDLQLQVATAEARYIAANKHRAVTVVWPDHARHNRVNGDCYCTLE